MAKGMAGSQGSGQGDLWQGEKEALRRPHPFLKWAGGKNQLLEFFRNHYPAGLGERYTSYIEPFVGGGAVLFAMLSVCEWRSVVISDINAELMYAYLAVRDACQELIDTLSVWQEEYWPLDGGARKEYYYAKRADFNRLKADLAGNDGPSRFPASLKELSGEERQGALELAELLIFLNHTCFNGLYRVNRQGLFNVPIGAYARPPICDEANLQAVTRVLQGVDIRCASYDCCLEVADEHSFVYLDPPYRPLAKQVDRYTLSGRAVSGKRKNAGFTAYAAEGFGDEEQVRLAQVVRSLDSRCGAAFMLSNSDPRSGDPQDDFFDRLYEGFKILRLQASRSINCLAHQRGKVSEILVLNR